MNAINTDLAVARVAVVKVAESLRAHLAAVGGPGARLNETTLAAETGVDLNSLSPLQQVLFLMSAEAAFLAEDWASLGEGEWQAA